MWVRVSVSVGVSIRLSNASGRFSIIVKVRAYLSQVAYTLTSPNITTVCRSVRITIRFRLRDRVKVRA